MNLQGKMSTCWLLDDFRCPDVHSFWIVAAFLVWKFVGFFLCMQYMQLIASFLIPSIRLGISAHCQIPRSSPGSRPNALSRIQKCLDNGDPLGESSHCWGWIKPQDQALKKHGNWQPNQDFPCVFKP